ncbi:MAG: riboflavin synthase [Myxococcota bacterium]|nr:riboflavin synthase [Myxococcota bacterium]
MFSGIVEELGVIEDLEPMGNGYRLSIRSPFVVSYEAGVGRIDRERVGLGDSIAINGVCLTVDQLQPPSLFSVVCGQETWSKTSFSSLRTGHRVHLERALRVGDRLDGHLVQGHVDGLARVISNKKERESWILWLTIPREISRYCAVKGSLTVDGVSLTINEINGQNLRLNIVPYTAEETLLSSRKSGEGVNIEVDVIARYVERLIGGTDNGLSFSRLEELGYRRWSKGD